MTAWPLLRPWHVARSTRQPDSSGQPIFSEKSIRAMPAKPRAWYEWTPWAYCIAAAPLVFLLVGVLWDAARQSSVIRSRTLRGELQRLQSQALQQAKGLEVLVEAHAPADMGWLQICQQPWFENYWSKVKPSEHELYVAVVDDTGQVAVHSDLTKIGRRLESGWYERKVSQAEPDVVLTRRSALSGERSAYDVTVALSSANGELADYHEAVDAEWLESKIEANQESVRSRWFGVLAFVGSLDAAAVAALFFLARNQGRGWRACRGQRQERTRELSQIGAGLAHEIRNPLHALRINLHTLRRSFGNRSLLPEEQLLASINESESAIDRLDELIRDLLQFTDRGAGQLAEIDLVHEVRAALDLLRESLQHKEIAVNAKLPSRLPSIAIDRVRLRQLLLNVLTLALHRAGKGGLIDLEVTRANGGIELVVGDSGPLLPEEQRARVFEPFQAPDETGSGLGLALVQVYVEEVGGRVSWDQAAATSRCRLWFPLAPSVPKGGQL